MNDSYKCTNIHIKYIHNIKKRALALFKDMTRPISRVLSCAAIYLHLPSPAGSSRHYPISAEPALRYEAPIDVASDRVYIAVQSPVLW